MPDGLTPRKLNGGLDWLAYVRTTWPIMIGLIGFVFWVSGRLQTPEQKRMLFRNEVRPMEIRLERLMKDVARLDGELQAHMRIPAHAVMQQRYEDIRDDLQEIKNLLKARNP